jgi:nicotinate-nucleotide adenylyltransferase
MDPELIKLLERHKVNRLDPARSGQIRFCPVTQLEIASSDIRQRLAAGRSADYLLPAAVLDLIERHQLYR